FMCRSCRFKKCVEFGMTFDVSPAETVNIERPIDEPSTSTAVPIVPSPQAIRESILDRINHEYRESADQRRVKELAFAKEVNLIKTNHPSQEYFISNVRHNYESLRILVTESMPLIRSVYSNFDSLSLDVKVALSKCFIKFSVVESYYLTQRDWRDTTYFVVSLITCFDLNNSSEWVTKGDNIQREEDLKQFLRQYATEYTMFLMSIRKSESISERELQAMIVLSFLDLDAADSIPDGIHEEAEKIRAQVFDELAIHYRDDLKVTDYAGKIGRLVSIYHTMSEASTVLAEELRMYSTVFGV
ncbi:hypothetical protein PFISCL1PPCAC_14336, partial [Pristionchus fissidentatus]